MSHIVVFSWKSRFLFISGIIATLFLQSCIKDKYNFSKLSTSVRIAPAVAFPVIRGSLMMENMVKPNDTIVFDDNGGVKFVYGRDSVFVLSAAQILNIPDQKQEDVYIPVGPFRSDGFSHDTVFYTHRDTFNLDIDTLQLTRLDLRRGTLSYTVNSPLPEEIDFNITFPTGVKDRDTLKYSFAVNGDTVGSLPLDNASFDLSTDTARPYNILPYQYTLTLRSSGNPVDFNVADSLHFTYRLKNLDFQYVKGYFGQQDFLIQDDSLDVGLDEFFSNITGTISLTNPQVRLLYRNGIGIPAELMLKVAGETNAGDVQPLNAPSMEINYPPDRTASSAEGELAFTKDNTDIVPLIDLHPSYVVYGGKAVINPGGFRDRTNFISAHSNIIVDMEMEVPLEFRMKGLELRDTIENPFHSGHGDSSDFGLKDLDYAKLHVFVNNGFPVGVDFKIFMYDSLSHTVVDSVSFNQVVEAAPVDDNGRVTGPVSSKQVFELDRMQLDNMENVDHLIVAAIFNSSNQGSESVKIYTDYTFDFKLAFEAKVNYEFDLNGPGN